MLDPMHKELLALAEQRVVIAIEAVLDERPVDPALLYESLSCIRLIRGDGSEKDVKWLIHGRYQKAVK